MANRNTHGFGLKAAMRAGNTPSIQGQSKYEIDAGESNAIFNGEPVVVDLSTSTGGYIVTAAAGTSMVGVLNGVTFTDATTLKPTFSNFYPAATTPANSEDITAFVNDDPFQEYMTNRHQDRSDAVENDLMKEQDSRMPINVERQSRVTFGGTKK